MRLSENPFCVLGVTPCSSIDEITENAENKAFIDDDNVQVYEDARTILISPNRRIAAELRYIDNIEKVKDLVHLIATTENLKFCTLKDDRKLLLLYTESLYTANDFDTLTFLLTSLEVCYKSLNSDENIRENMVGFNSCREKAGIELCNDVDVVGTEIKKLKDDIRVAIDYLLGRLSQENIIRFANKFAEYLFKKHGVCGEIGEIFFSCYDNCIHERLTELKREIMCMIEDAKSFSKQTQLQPLCEKVRIFDDVAQPLQLFLKSLGRSSMQTESLEVATAVRNLALYFHNEKGKTFLSKILVDLEIELFSELVEFLPTLENDQHFVDIELFRQEVIKSKNKGIFDWIFASSVHYYFVIFLIIIIIGGIGLFCSSNFLLFIGGILGVSFLYGVFLEFLRFLSRV